ncbi:nucleotidyl transferase AbiEii/AbiGii toxin family protein [Patescibacteria group bacterium]|nr:nucleotidyl transferase AbiEii/AbiGii toxin family protein [Patescibacteria group bacterium]
MITLTTTDAAHKAWLYRMLIAIVDNNKLHDLYFKGGTAAAMAGYLDRFSVDLDFDYVGKQENILVIRQELKKIFKDLGLEIKDESSKVPQFFLKYPTKNPDLRNTLKIDITFPAPLANKYEPVKLRDIERIVVCQDISTMFANKLVALIDRFERNKSLAGRDVYDIHHFFLSGYNYNSEVIIERTGLTLVEFFNKLIVFIEKHITMTVFDQDLNFLLPYDRFRQLRKTLKIETEMLIKEEIKKLEG